MATRTGRLLQDPNLGIHMDDGSTISAKASVTGQKKVGPSGRKPLGDVSNGGGRKALDSLNSLKEVVPVKIKNNDIKRTSSKGPEKLPTGNNRRALSDISNIGKVKNKNSQKLNVLAEKNLSLDAIAEEQCLHNHQACIKSQTGDMSLRNLYDTVGLECGPDDKLVFSSEVQAFTKLKSKIDLEFMHLELEAEKFPEQEFLSSQHASPARFSFSEDHCKSPMSCHKMWEDYDANFKLMETPKSYML